MAGFRRRPSALTVSPRRPALARSRLIAFLLTVTAAAVVSTAPFYAAMRPESPAHTFMIATATPVLFAFLPLVLPPLQRPVAVLLVLFSWLAGMSVGLFYLPGAVVLFFPGRAPKTPVR